MCVVCVCAVCSVCCVCACVLCVFVCVGGRDFDQVDFCSTGVRGNFGLDLLAFGETQMAPLLLFIVVVVAVVVVVVVLCVVRCVLPLKLCGSGVMMVCDLLRAWPPLPA